MGISKILMGRSLDGTTSATVDVGVFNLSGKSDITDDPDALVERVTLITTRRVQAT
jgi:hypothetical protein